MAELSFIKEGSKYVCEFGVSHDFNLHIERNKGGFLFLYQRSSDGGSFDSVGDAKFAPNDHIIDYDCTALVYPKTIKIVSEVEPTYAAVTSAGEVTEIKSQDKSVEVTSNGTIDVTPDAGFAYLNSVKVKTNVAQSGGGGGSASTMEYIDVSGASGLVKTSLVQYACYVKGNIEDYDTYMTGVPFYVLSVMASNPTGAVTAIAIDFSNIFVMKMGDTFKRIPTAEAVLQNGASQADIDALPRITEEEFYTL